jgi:hypothetical protein
MRPMRLIVGTVLTLGGIALLAPASQAKPEYAMREKKACGYCHVNPAGGGARNPRGVYYKMHNLTFKDYDEEKVMGTAGQAPKKSGPPAFKSAWRMDLPKEARRIAVMDLTDDKKPRLIVLGKGNTATIYKTSPTAIEKEAEVDLGKNAVQFVAGHFAKGKPGVIAAPGVIIYNEGGQYVRKETADLGEITGSVRYVDGTEQIFYFAGGQPDVYTVDLGGAKLIAPGKEMVGPEQGGGVYADLSMHPPVELLAQLQLPEEGQKTGTVGLIDPRAEGKLYVWIPWAGKEASTLRVYKMEDMMNAANVMPAWESGKLGGKILDVTTGADPTGKTKGSGMYVLQSIGLMGQDRFVEFFALD